MIQKHIFGFKDYQIMADCYPKQQLKPKSDQFFSCKFTNYWHLLNIHCTHRINIY